MTKPGFSFCVNFMLQNILLRTHVCFCCVGYSFSVLSQEIGWEERFRNDLLLCQVGRKTLTQSVNLFYRLLQTFVVWLLF